MNKCKNCIHKIDCRLIGNDNCSFYKLKDNSIIHFKLVFGNFEAKCFAPADLTITELLSHKKRIKLRVPCYRRKYTSFMTDLWFTHKEVFIMNREAAEYLKICKFSAEE